MHITWQYFIIVAVTTLLIMLLTCLSVKAGVNLVLICMNSYAQSSRWCIMNILSKSTNIFLLYWKYRFECIFVFHSYILSQPNIIKYIKVFVFLKGKFPVDGVWLTSNIFVSIQLESLVVFQVNLISFAFLLSSSYSSDIFYIKKIPSLKL